MSILRSHLSFETDFTRIPNDWLRDERLSWKGRGLLAHIMSHRAGWRITIGSLQNAGPDGRDAVRSGIDELLALGYLRREQSRQGGQFAEVNYELCEPPTSTAVGFSDSGSPDSGKSPPKKNISKEEHLKEETPVRPPGSTTEIVDIGDAVKAKKDALAESQSFERAWKLWPKKTDKATARKRWPNAVKKSGMTPDGLADIVIRHAAVLRQREPQFIPHLAVWLNKERWEDDLAAIAQSARPAGGFQSRYLEA